MLGQGVVSWARNRVRYAHKTSLRRTTLVVRHSLRARGSSTRSNASGLFASADVGLDKLAIAVIFITVGRPKKFDRVFKFRLSDELYQHAQQVASDAGLDLGEVCRRALKGSRVHEKSILKELDALREIYALQRKLGGLCKLALMQDVERHAARRALAELEQSAAAMRGFIARALE